MKRKKIDLFGLFAVTVCVLGSALLLRFLLSGSLEAYSNQVQVGVQAERIRTPLQESDEDEQTAVSGKENGVRATPEPAYSNGGEVESGLYEASGLPGSPMGDEAYLAGYMFTQQAENMVIEACYNRYGESPLAVVKTYMESSHSIMGYAWLGVAELPDDSLVIFHYNGMDDVWTQRSAADFVYDFLHEQSENAKNELRGLITVHLEDSLVNGFSDWG